MGGTTAMSAPFGSLHEHGAAAGQALIAVGAPSALRRMLPDFDRPAPPRAPFPAPVRTLFAPEPPPAEAAEAVPALPAVDRIAEAVSLALAEAERSHAERESALAAAHAAELVAARARWVAEESAALAEGFRAAAAALGDALGEAAAEALAPLLGEAGRALAVEGLREAVADLVRAGSAGTIAVSGPADLLDALRAALGAAGLAVEAMSFAPSEQAEVTVAAGDSRVETRLVAWAGALRRRLPGSRGEPGEVDATDEVRA